MCNWPYSGGSWAQAWGACSVPCSLPSARPPAALRSSVLVNTLRCDTSDRKSPPFPLKTAGSWSAGPGPVASLTPRGHWAPSDVSARGAGSCDSPQPGTAGAGPSDSDTGVWPERGLLPPPKPPLPTQPPIITKVRKRPLTPSPHPSQKNAIIYAEKTQSKAAGGLSPSSSRW